MSLQFLQKQFLSNQISDYLIALAVLFAGSIVARLLCRFIFQRLKKWADKTPTSLDNRLIAIIESHSIPIIYLGSFYLAISNLALHPILDKVVNVILIILATIIGVRLINSLVKYLLRLYWITHSRNNSNFELTINAILPAIRTIVWVIGLLFILDNLGFNISAVIASLGIGGVAVALASQGILQDLFSYFAILLDRPFELGDFIIVGDYMGDVEYVGIKTTRLKSIDGEEIIIANTDLTGSRIRNFKRMRQRRIVFDFGVVYETHSNQLTAIPSIVENIIRQTKNTTFDRAHFLAYGDFSLNFEVAYLINSNDYDLYMDAQQQINFQLKQEFDRKGIQFAYPTQISYLRSSATSDDRNTSNANSNNLNHLQDIHSR